ncbi:MAG: hypothetical protein ABSH08_13960 [Tepidisphaeraceae bacterium]|jgi:hypothetical protein
MENDINSMAGTLSGQELSDCMGELQRRQATMTGSLDQHEAEIETLKSTVAHMLGLRTFSSKMSPPETKTENPWFVITDEKRRSLSDREILFFLVHSQRQPDARMSRTNPGLPFTTSNKDRFLENLKVRRPILATTRSSAVPANRVFLPLSGVLSLATLGLAQEYSGIVLINGALLIPALIVLTSFTFVGLFSFRRSKKRAGI